MAYPCAIVYEKNEKGLALLLYMLREHVNAEKKTSFHTHNFHRIESLSVYRRFFIWCLFFLRSFLFFTFT